MFITLQELVNSPAATNSLMLSMLKEGKSARVVEILHACIAEHEAGSLEGLENVMPKSGAQWEEVKGTFWRHFLKSDPKEILEKLVPICLPKFEAGAGSKLLNHCIRARASESFDYLLDKKIARRSKTILIGAFQEGDWELAKRVKKPTFTEACTLLSFMKGHNFRSDVRKFSAGDFEWVLDYYKDMAVADKKWTRDINGVSALSYLALVATNQAPYGTEHVEALTEELWGLMLEKKFKMDGADAPASAMQCIVAGAPKSALMILKYFKLGPKDITVLPWKETLMFQLPGAARREYQSFHPGYNNAVSSQLPIMMAAVLSGSHEVYNEVKGWGFPDFSTPIPKHTVLDRFTPAVKERLIAQGEQMAIGKILQKSSPTKAVGIRL